MDIPAYWRSVHAKEAELKERFPFGCLFITPTNDSAKNTCGGDCVEATIENAARMLITGTAREASADEIALYRQHQKENRSRDVAQTLRNEGAVRVFLSRASGER